MHGFLTTRQVADEISDSPLVAGIVDEWQVRRLYEDGDLPEVEKFANKRAISRDSIPRIVEALRRRGWLPEQAEVASA
jgi:hypothetical protein